MASIRAVTRMPLSGVAGSTSFYTFNGLSGPDHFAVRFGDPSGTSLVRVHSECVTGDVFGSLKCDCGSQLKRAIRMLNEQTGWLLYLRQEGRGIGLAAKLDAYVLQERGMDTYAANLHLGFGEDERGYDDAALMLQAIGVGYIKLMTNNSEKAEAVRHAGVNVRSIVRCPGTKSPFNAGYLESKRVRSATFHQLHQTNIHHAALVREHAQVAGHALLGHPAIC